VTHTNLQLVTMPSNLQGCW